MALTYEPIATTTLGNATSGITFSSIPNTYTDLRLVIVGTVTLNGEKPNIILNSDTGQNYSWTIIYGNGTTAASSRGTNYAYLNPSWAGSMSDTIPTLWTLDFMNYKSSNFKSALAKFYGDLNGSGYVSSVVHLWRSTSAISTIYCYASGSTTFKAGTTATLFGIKAA